jgi:hypothetical protein
MAERAKNAGRLRRQWLRRHLIAARDVAGSAMADRKGIGSTSARHGACEGKPAHQQMKDQRQRGGGAHPWPQEA